MIGKIFKSKKDGCFKVLEFSHSINYIGNRHPVKYYNIEFLDTGYITKSTNSSINSGEIKDYLKPSDFNGGFVGGKINTSDKYLYQRWKSMLERCNNSNCKDYRSYGAKGVTVCEEWHNFKNYIKDVKFLNGYNEEGIRRGELELYKDIKNKK